METDPTRTAFTVRPHASVIDAGAPGSVAAAAQVTVEVPLEGGVSAPEYCIVYVYVQSAVVMPSQPVYR